MNKAIIMGRLTRDPELKFSSSNMGICSFSVAVDRKFKRDGEPTADFLNVVTFGKTAEFVSKWFSKGKLILVCGRIQVRNWEDKDGNKRTSVDIVADEVSFAGDKGGADSSPRANSTPASFDLPDNISDFSEISDDDGDVPF